MSSSARSDKVINCVPTFGMYQFSTEVCGGKVTVVPRDASHAVNIAGVKEAIDNRTKVIFIASPNNPTGNTTPEQDVLALVETGIMVVVDEACRTCSAAAEIVSLVAEDEVTYARLKSAPQRVCGLDVPIPYSPPMEQYVIPGRERITEAVDKVLHG